jgi:hypothetical protein
MMTVGLASALETHVRAEFETILSGKNRESEAIVLWEASGVTNRMLKNITKEITVTFNFIESDGTPGYGVVWINSVAKAPVDEAISKIVSMVSDPAAEKISGGGNARKASRPPSAEVKPHTGGSAGRAGTLADEVREELNRSERIRRYREDKLRFYSEE